MKSESGVPPPNYTAVPNAYLDTILNQIESMSELKVTLAIMRKTFGWQKKSDTISISQLIEITGLSEQSVRNGLASGIERGVINRIPDGQSFNYTLNIKAEPPQELYPPKNYTPLKVRPQEVQDLGGLGVQDLDPQKKPGKEKKETNTSSPTAQKASKKKSEPARTADPRTKHPAIQLIKGITGRLPPLVLYDEIIELLGKTPNGKHARDCLREWAARGKYINDFNTWLFDWYKNGISERNGNGQPAKNYTKPPVKRDFSKYGQRT